MNDFVVHHKSGSLISAWRKGEHTAFPDPLTFNIKLRTALYLESEASDGINATEGKPLSALKRKPRNKHPKKHGWRTQAEVAKDFGVSVQTVKKWDKESPTHNECDDNPWGYYAELRLLRELEGPYRDLVGMVAHYRRENSKRTTYRQISFRSFRDGWWSHSH